MKIKFKSLFDKATKAIYAEQFDFSELVKYLCNDNNNSDLLKTYIVIQLVTENILPIDKTIITKAINLYLEAEKMLINTKESSLMLSYNEAKAQKVFFESKEYFTYGQIAYNSNRYSYEGLKYKLEKVKKGPLTLEEHQKYKALSKQILEAENNLEEHTNKATSDEALDDVFDKIKLEVEEDIKINGKKTNEELDKEYENLIKEFKKTIK